MAVRLSSRDRKCLLSRSIEQEAVTTQEVIAVAVVTSELSGCGQSVVI